MQVVVDETINGALLGGVYARDILSQMEKIRLDVAGSEHHTYRGMCAWFVHTPKLREMNVVGRLSDPNRFLGWSLPLQPVSMKLRRITLRDVELTDETDGMMGHLHLPPLEILELTDCTNAAPFLRSLAKMCKQTNNTSLDTFTHSKQFMLEDVQEASAELIRSAKGLTEIVVGAMEGGLMDLNAWNRTASL